MRFAAGFFLSIVLISQSTTALGADYVSPTSWFGYPGTMLNAEKTFTVWFPGKPAIKRGDEKIGAISVPKVWYYNLRFNSDPIAVFDVNDFDFSKLESGTPDEAYIAFLHASGVKNFVDTPEPFGTAMGHRLTYGLADHPGNVIVRMVSNSGHLYTAGAVLPEGASQTVKDEADHFVNSLSLFDGQR